MSSWKKAVTGSVFVASLVIAMVAGSTGIAAAQGTGHGPGHFTFSSSSSSSSNAASKWGPGNQPRHSGGLRGFGHGPTVKGTVSGTPSSTSFTLNIPGCSTAQTITTSSTTTYFAPGTGVTQTGLSAGEHVIVTLISGSTLTAKSVTILFTQVSGVVSSTSPFVVTDGQGFEHTIDVSSATTYTPSGATISLGENITAYGVIASDNVTLDALVIRVRPASSGGPTGPFGNGHIVVGVVAAGTTTPTFTVDETGGTTQTITVNGSTKYFETGTTTPPAGVAAGEHVAVSLVSGSSPATASRVVIFLNQLDGTVISTGTTSFVIADHQGFYRTINVGAGTVYSPSTATLSTLTGKHVAAFGSVDADGVSLDAQFVDVFTFPAFNSSNWELWQKTSYTCPVVTSSSTSSNPSPTWPPKSFPGSSTGSSTNHVIVTGTVQSVTTTTDLIVVAQHNGSTTTVLVTGTTTYRDGSTSDPTLQTVAGLPSTTPITVFGTSGPGSEVTASQVVIGATGGGWGNGPGSGYGSGTQVSGHNVPTPSVHFGGPPSVTSSGAGRSDGGAGGSRGGYGGSQSPFGGGQSGH